jgi:hypothetical protein
MFFLPTLELFFFLYAPIHFLLSFPSPFFFSFSISLVCTQVYFCWLLQGFLDKGSKIIACHSKIIANVCHNLSMKAF